ncbi:hypothetical protein ACFL6U_27355 [Planctomycetota bacterium]
MTNSHVEKKQQSIIRPRPALFGALVAIALNFALLQPTAASDGSAIKTTMPPAGAAETGEPEHTADSVSRELANPNSSLSTLKFQNQYRWYTGDLPGAKDQDNYTMLFQPVFPLALPPDDSGNKSTIFFRPAFPLVFDQPVLRNNGLGFDKVSALGDIQFDLAYGVSRADGVLWAVGMVGTLPTATDQAVAGKQLRLGPEMLLAKFEKWGLYGIFPSHQWNVTGWSKESYNTTQFQPVLKFLLNDGWTAGTAPIGFYNWGTSDWTVPLNLTISKTAIFGKIPWKFDIEVNYYFDQPNAFGPEWMIGFNFAPVINNPFQKLFNRLIGVK